MALDNVLLGFVDAEIDPSGPNIQNNWTVNKIGGLPIWKDLRINKLQPKCKLCGELSALLVQLYCPLGTSKYHRTLFIYCCVTPSCWNKSESWWAIRCQTLDEQTEPQTINSPARDEWLQDEGSWCEDENIDDQNEFTEECTKNDFSEVCAAMDNVNVTKLSQEPPQQMDQESSEALDVPGVIPETIGYVSPAPYLDYSDHAQYVSERIFRPYYIAVSEEPSETIDSDQHVQQLLQNYQMTSGNPFANLDNCSENRMERESYEKAQVKHGDRYFYKFCKRIRRSPKQIIRYQWSGQALPISSDADTGGPLLCPHCSSQSIFELQIMPALLRHLNLKASTMLTGPPVEFGTALIYSCSESCWNSSELGTVRYEKVIVQPDPYEHIFQEFPARTPVS